MGTDLNSRQLATVFYSYSHRDEALKEKLDEQLSVLKRRGLISTWHDREIAAGTNWKDQIDDHLDTADVILLLVSPSFIASDYCWDREMKRALERHSRGHARVMPVILRPCLWQETPFAELQAVPKDARPVTLWQDQDEAFFSIATAIQQAVKELQRTGPSTSSASPAQPKSAGSGSAFRVVADPATLPDFTAFKELDVPWCPEMVVLPPGEFLMGRPTEDDDGSPGGRQHLVKIGYRLAIGRYAVTFDEYDYFCAETGRNKPDDSGWGRGRRPVINVTWKDATWYCEWLTSETGCPYRLPTESEWEYSCRAGTRTRFAFGDRISTSKARYGLTSLSTVEVGEYQPNLWGLFDMHGNVYEWVRDAWCDDYAEDLCDGGPAPDTEGEERRVVRGGAWSWAESTGLRSYCRASFKYMESERNVGFRVARTL